MELVQPDENSNSIIFSLQPLSQLPVPPGKSQGCLYSGTLDTDPEAGIFVGGGGFQKRNDKQDRAREES